jgi:hypothetical protein
MLSADLCIIKGLKTKQAIVKAQITKVHVLTLTFFTEGLICAAYPLSKKSEDKHSTIGNARNIVVNKKKVCIFTES